MSSNLSAQEDGAKSVVRVSNSSVTVTSHVITDLDVVLAFKAAEEQKRDLSGFFDLIVRIGALATSVTSANMSAEKIEASVLQASASIRGVSEQLERSIEKRMIDFSSADGDLVKGFASIIEDMKSDLEALADGEEAPFKNAVVKVLQDADQKIQASVAKEMSKQKEDIATLLDIASPTSPLRALAMQIEGIGTAIAKVQEDVTKEKAIANVLEAGVVGGLDYEEEVILWVQRIASANGDDCEPTGNITGNISKSKKGDGIVDLKVGGNTRARIVLEAKNRQLSKLDWERERDGSKANRAATSFIGLCKYLDDMPNGNRVLILDPTSIVVAFNPEIDDPELLVLIYRVIKLNALSGSGSIDEVNVVEVNTNLEEAVKALAKFTAITKEISAIKGSADRIAGQAIEIKNAISERLFAAQSAMHLSLSLPPHEGSGAVGLVDESVPAIEES